jgi:hypothetical protein
VTLKFCGSLSNGRSPVNVYFLMADAGLYGDLTMKHCVFMRIQPAKTIEYWLLTEKIWDL